MDGGRNERNGGRGMEEGKEEGRREGWGGRGMKEGREEGGGRRGKGWREEGYLN